MGATEWVQTVCLLSHEQHARLKHLSRQTHVSMAAYLRIAVTKLLAEQARKGLGKLQGEEKP
jgi:hypothetical protein